MRQFEKIPQRDFNEMRAFCDHELAATIDGDGGICELSIIDCYEHQDVVYPDEVPLPIFSRGRGEFLGRPLYGAALQAYTVTRNKRAILHRPTEQTVSPWGLTGRDTEQTYRLMLDNYRVLWQFSCNEETRDTLQWCCQTNALFCGEKEVHMNQHRGAGSTQIGGLYTVEELERMSVLPKINGVAQVHWIQQEFDEQEQVLFFQGQIDYPFGQREYILAVGSDASLAKRQAQGMTILQASWEERETITFGLAIGTTRREALESLRNGVKEFDNIWWKKESHAVEIEKLALTVHTEKLSSSADFCQMTAQYLDSLLVGRTEDGYIGVRAAAEKYGYFSIWDAIYPIRDMLWNHQKEDACRQIKYLLKLPLMENTPISSLHAIVQWNEVRAFCPESELENLYPEVLKIFRLASKSTEPQYRLLMYTGNAGADHAEEVGLTGLFLAPEVNALWYMASRIVRNEAINQGDWETVKQADDIIQGVEKGYRKVFFSEKEGYLRAAADTNLQPAAFEVFHNSNTMGYDYPLGMYLMRDMVDSLAHYQSHQLWHPLGHRAVCFDSEVPCEMWKYVHMNQHNGHEMKLQRMAGNIREVYRVMNEYLKVFDRWKVAQETNNYSRFAIDASQVCSWQAFSATANMEALRMAVAGIMKHRGGICYLPVNDMEKIVVERVPNGNHCIDITIEGHGAYAVLQADEQLIEGTLQLPADVICSKLVVKRITKLPTYPVLNYALDLPIKQVTACDKTLQFVCDSNVHTPICLLSVYCPTVTVNGKPVSLEWQGDKHMAWIDRRWHAGDTVKVEIL